VSTRVAAAKSLSLKELSANNLNPADRMLCVATRQCAYPFRLFGSKQPSITLRNVTQSADASAMANEELRISNRKIYLTYTILYATRFAYARMQMLLWKAPLLVKSVVTSREEFAHLTIPSEVPLDYW
jgi:hypothetical protein